MRNRDVNRQIEGLKTIKSAFLLEARALDNEPAEREIVTSVATLDPGLVSALRCSRGIS